MTRSVPLAEITALLREALSGAAQTVTARPPQTARNGVNGEQINLYLYHVLPDPAMGNSVASPGSPTPSNGYSIRLKYMVTAYDDDADAPGQELIGRVIGLFQDHPVLDVSDVENIQQVQVIMDPLTPEQLAALWASFQTGYCLSVCYEVRVVLAQGQDRE